MRGRASTVLISCSLSGLPYPRGMSAPATSASVAVVGAGIAGMAVAARLAKLGHPVELYEAEPSLGGAWAPYDGPDGERVDDAPGVIGFPAPWRDLFRKSGRPLEAELARMGYALTPAPPPRVEFADGSALIMPTDRGEQYDTLARAYGRATADRWQALLDRLDRVWQVLRPLGQEAEFPRRRGGLDPRHRLDRATRSGLLGRRLSVARLAADLGHPHLTALIRSVAYRAGSTPERTPAFAAVELSLQRTFGRWEISTLVTPAAPTAPAAPAAPTAQRSSILIDALVARLTLRKVTVHPAVRVHGVEVDGNRVVGVHSTLGVRPTGAVISTVDPWQALGVLVPAEQARRTRQDVFRLRPAAAPLISHWSAPVEPSGEGERIVLTSDGVPTISYTRAVAARASVAVSLTSSHDFTRTRPRAGYGVAWNGFGSWLHRPPITTELAGLFLAGPFSAAGPGPSHVVLSGALASYACQAYLQAR